MQHQMNAADTYRSLRRVRHGYEFVLGPGGSVSDVRIIPYTPPFSPRELLIDEDFAAAVLGVSSSAAAQRVRSGAKRARVDAAVLGLPELAGRSREGEECAICLQDFRADEALRAMPCCHAFHHHCISQWLRCNAVCPLCRHQLPDEDEEQRRTRRMVQQLAS